MIGLSFFKYVGALIFAGGVASMSFIGKDVASFVGKASNFLPEDRVVEVSYSQIFGVSSSECASLDSALNLGFGNEVSRGDLKRDYYTVPRKYILSAPDSVDQEHVYAVADSIVKLAGLEQRSLNGDGF